ncbi:hypothetical protein M1L60_21330 [Actinoplanes sp. TRM 88003]|uniref:Uncharacterized protein n=1 Tax=Paractinoplanes aksuensis TaxID=2939490 RepID=A0ABT1DQL5_9ACTN|nr:hypothetical protein [Actinoplanes aksuensis]MCO8273139.1 hypothetical protein [Actinoplanes aksuensis]
MLIRKRWWQPLWLSVLVVALMLGRALNRGRDDWSGTVAFLVIVTVTPSAFLLTRVLFRRHLRRWAARGEWTEIDPDERRWPWPDGRIKVPRAWQREIDGLPVTFGEIRWRNHDFDGTVPRRKGKGAFVVVRLPHPQPSMVLRHTFEPVGDSPRLDQPALFEAYVAGEIGPWAVRGDELFTVEPRDVWLDPQIADQAVRRALRTVQLLDLGPDTPGAEPR